jgi:chromosomal replication initiation ATPase DnaA
MRTGEGSPPQNPSERSQPAAAHDAGLRRSVVILGPVGVGKIFLATALGHLACRSGFNVLFHRADALLRKLRQSRLDNSRDALMAELVAIDRFQNAAYDLIIEGESYRSRSASVFRS